MGRAVIIIVAVLAAVVVLFLLRKPKAGSPGVQMYSDVRSDIIGRVVHGASKPRVRPTRSPSIETRLPLSQAQKFRAASPSTQAGSTTYAKYYSNVIESIRAELNAIDPEHGWYELLTPERRAVLLLEELESEVNNGGFDQYFLNSSGDGAALRADALRLLKLDALAALVERANAQFPKGPSPFREPRLAEMEKLGDAASKAWGELDDAFYAMKSPAGGFAIGVGGEFILSHQNEFFMPQ